MHKKYTGVSNELIINNLKQLVQIFGNIIIRIPFVPGYNSEDKVQREIYQFISGLKKIKRVEIMPYHRIGKNKYSGLGRNYKLKDLEAVNKKELSYLVKLGLEFGIKVHLDAQQ